MTLRLLFLNFILLSTAVLFAQRDTPQQAIANDFYPAEAIKTYDLRKTTTIKRVFFKEEWLNAQMVFIDPNKKSNTLPMKYDILNQELTVSVGNEIYALPQNLIDGFILSDLLGNEVGRFVILKNENQGETGIFEMVVKGTFTLLKKHSAKVNKANYQPALDAGSRDDKAIRRSTLYLMDDRQQFLEIPSSKKQAKEMFSRYKKASNYLAENKVNFKNSDSLKDLVIYMNNK